ncbi:TBC1 domain family member 7-like [Watersipora subatra]|uniref:TBC1 domain family member 7-like n=1 Tax=Watersipora subatra TaxID=2589382 RepID=UPI00355AD835
MTSSEREDSIQNFRSSYYHKLGSTTTSGVEEKKKLVKLLNMQPLDLRKLEQFCQHLHVPNDYRLELWKIILKIAPIYQSTNEYVAVQRLEHFTELSHIVDLLRIIPSDHDNYTTYKCVMMYLVEEKTFLVDFKQICKLAEALLCFNIAKAVRWMDLNDCDTYWVTRNFTTLVRQRIHPHIPCLVEKSYQNMQREDLDGKLSEHLRTVGAYDKLPFHEWFYDCFSSALPEATYARVWDKVISGSTAVLVNVAVALLLINRRAILFRKTTPEILNLLSQITVETGEEGVRRGIELWQRNGGKLTPNSARASPAVLSDRSPTPTLVQF